MVNVVADKLVNSIKHRINSAEPDPFALERLLLKGVGRFVWQEVRHEGIASMLGTVRDSIKQKELVFRPDRTLGEMFAVQADRYGSKSYVYFENAHYSYNFINDQAARIAQYLLNQNVGIGACVGILLPNMPAYLSIFLATQRVGATAVPINTSLKDDGLAYILNNAEIKMLFTVQSMLPELERIKTSVSNDIKIVVVPESSEEKTCNEGAAYTNIRDVLTQTPQAIPVHDIAPNTASMLMYTSGTTGYPKGVVYTYGASQAKMTRFLAPLLVTEDDVYYTCLPLFHANALIVTAMSVMHAGATLALSKKFSASKFWQEIRESRATIFNTLGTMIAILMKQPEHPLDGQHNVTRVISAACPAPLWAGFQSRFNVKLIESFGAVDGGGIVTLNAGNAPAGSIGKPLGKVRWRLIDEQGKDVPQGTPGELIHYAGESKNKDVTYFKNEAASEEKVRDGWVHSGDLMWSDKNGFLYFAGRNSDSMRCGGENVSALEVENIVNKYPTVLESAAFGVPSELAEDDVMVVVQPKADEKIDPQSLYDFLLDKLPKYALPRYIRISESLPKTETHRIIKKKLKEEGVTKDCWKLN